MTSTQLGYPVLHYNMHWGLVEPACSFLQCATTTSLGPGMVVKNGFGAALPYLCNSMCQFKSGNGPLESMTPGDLHWGLVEPDCSMHDCTVTADFGPGVVTYNGPGAIWRQCVDPVCHADMGKGPPESFAPGDLHWGLVEPNCASPYNTAAMCLGPGVVTHKDLHWDLVESSCALLHRTAVHNSGPGEVQYKDPFGGLVVPHHALLHDTVIHGYGFRVSTPLLCRGVYRGV